MFNLNNTDPMGLVLVTLPLLIFVVSLVMQLIFKKRLIILVVSFVLCLIATFTVFNLSFLIYSFVYTIISLLGTLSGDLIIICKNKLLKKVK